MRKRGFTLIEVLLAFFLSMMVIFIAFSILDSSIDQQSEMVDVFERRKGGSKIIAYIRNDLQGIMDLTSMQQASSVQIMVDPAGNAVINFVSSGRQSVNDEGVVSAYNEVGYALKKSKLNNEVYVLYRRQDYFVDDEIFSGGQYELLYEGVKSMTFEWAGEDGEWKEQWTEGCPMQVKLSIALLTQEAMKNIENLPINSEDWDVREFVEVIDIKYKSEYKPK